MFDSARLQADFSDAAAAYDTHAKLQQRVMQRLIERSKPLMPREGLVLDAGCGTGNLVRELTGYNVVGVDSAFRMCASASDKGETVVSGMIEALPFSDNSFDVVFSSLALQWLDEWQQGITEMKRVLKPGGVLAVSTFGDGTLHELKESFTSGDRHPHVSEFIAPESFGELEVITEHYASVTSLMRHLKIIGARNKLMMRSKTLMTARQLEAVENYYRVHFGTQVGLPVTWNVLYLVTQK